MYSYKLTAVHYIFLKILSNVTIIFWIAFECWLNLSLSASNRSQLKLFLEETEVRPNAIPSVSAAVLAIIVVNESYFQI